jgi:hypothetical protein
VRRTQLVQIAEELLTNALFNAPVDPSGEHPFRDLDRRQHAELATGQSVEVSLLADDNRFGIAVADPFGSLTVERFQTSLSRGFRGGEGQIQTTGGGAGIGLYTVYRASSHVTVAVTRRHRTRILAVLDPPSKRLAPVHGLDAFWAD